MTKPKEMSVEMSSLLKSIKAERVREDAKKLEMQVIKDRIDEKAQKLMRLEKREHYFFDNFCHAPGFGNGSEFEEFLRLLPEEATDYKRTIGLYLTYVEFAKKIGVGNTYKLDSKIVATVVEQYLDDLDILKTHSGNIKVQLPKIAGLMTNHIVKCHPIVPTDAEKDPYPRINELFAIHHALCVCSEFSDGAELEAFEKTHRYDIFIEDMLHLFRKDFTSESLITIFNTLCLYQFKSFLKKDDDR
jgi:hypothetical protein